MSDRHPAAEHHSAAAIHHQHAAEFHREASRHYEIGKDYAHAAHQAMCAHGHALHAMKEGDFARSGYAEHHLAAMAPPSDPGPQRAGSAEIADAETHAPDSASHHGAAERHQTQAAHHQREAARLCDERQYARAAHEAEMAYRHAHYSVFHDDEAAMHHVEHYGRSGQSAEIS